MSATIESVICHDCGATVNPADHTPNTGYGTDLNGNKVCFACCGKRDAEALVSGDERGVPMYLDYEDTVPVATTPNRISNWPGTLSIKLDHYRKSDHNMAGRNGRTDVWFTYGGCRFWGVCIGDMDLTRVKRLQK